MVVDRNSTPAGGSSPGKITRYVDGIFFGEIPLDTPDANMSAPLTGSGAADYAKLKLRIGPHLDADLIDGRVDGVRIYGRALSPGEIAQLKELTPTYVPTNTRGIAMWEEPNDPQGLQWRIASANYAEENVYFTVDATDPAQIIFAAQIVELGKQRNSTSIAAGDINGDNATDLVVGNDGAPNIYNEFHPIKISTSSIKYCLDFIFFNN